MSQYTFELVGADGERHSYLGTPFPPAAGGTALALQIYALAGGPLGALLKGIIDGAGGIGGILEMLDDKKRLADLNVEELISGVNMGDLGNSLAASLVRLPPQVLQDLLAHTSRDGSPLKQPANFNAAFTANYIELAQAAGLVALHNGFFTSGATSKKSAPKPSDDSETPIAELPA
jgi:hypothetical protein